MADDEMQLLRRSQHDLRDALQAHTMDLALKGQEMKTMQAQIAHLQAATISDEQLTAALGPLRGELALREQDCRALHEGLQKTATTEALAASIALMRSDSAVIKRDVEAVSATLTWVGRTVVGFVIVAVLGLLWQVSK